jgi:hypothetical protein
VPVDCLPEQDRLGNWLYLKLKKCAKFGRCIIRHKESKIGSRYRTFKWLWGKVREFLNEQQEDQNAAKVDAALGKGPRSPIKASAKAGGAVGKAESNAPKVNAAKAPPKAPGEAPAAAGSAKAPRAKSRGTRGGGGSPTSKAPGGKGGSDKAAAAKAKLPCLHFFSDKGCRFEMHCNFSHTEQPKAKGSSKGGGKGKGGGPPAKAAKAAAGAVATAMLLGPTGFTEAAATSAPVVTAEAAATAAPAETETPDAATPVALGGRNTTTDAWQREVLRHMRGWLPRSVKTVATAISACIPGMTQSIAGNCNNVAIEWIDDAGAFINQTLD